MQVEPELSSCPACNARTVSGQAFCENCGASLVSNAGTDEHSDAQRSANNKNEAKLRRALKHAWGRVRGWYASILARLGVHISATDASTSRTGPFTLRTDDYAARIPLAATYRFIHEPYANVTDFTYLGREAEVQELAQHILFSNSGAILITGYRGVGKTSFVNRSIEVAREVLASQSSAVDLVYIQFNLSREMDPDEIMYHIVRRLYQTLSEHGIMRSLGKETRSLVEWAYKRTAFSISRKMSSSRSGQVGLTSPAVLPLMQHGPSLLGASSRSTEETYSYLAYDDKAAEFDVIQLLRRLAQPPQGHHRRRKRVKTVIAFDELDKINAFIERDGLKVPNPYFEQVLAALKTLLSSSGATYLFVAGREFHRLWQDDMKRSDSVYESIFAHQLYLGCEWNFAENLLAQYQPENAVERTLLDALNGYLTFQSRGISRRAYRSLNRLVKWDATGPVIALSSHQLTRNAFYSQLDRLLRHYTKHILGPLRDRPNSQLYLDECRSYAYRLVETVIETAGRIFTSAELLRVGLDEVPLLSTYELATITNIVLDMLVENKQVEFVGEQHSGHAGFILQSGSREATLPRELSYRLSENALLRLPQLETDNGGNIAPALRVMGNYDLHHRIGEGGFTEVYLATDRFLGTNVAIKVARGIPVGEASSGDSLRNEARLLAMHQDIPGLVRLIQNKAEAQPPHLVLQYIEGIDLRSAVRQLRPAFTLEEALALAHAMAGPIIALHEREVIQLDIKPSNFILTKDGSLYMIDLGSAIDTSTDQGSHWTKAAVGTREYAAPELYSGGQPSELSDVYSFGNLLYELLMGRPPGARALSKLRNRLPTAGAPNATEARAGQAAVDLARLRRLLSNHFNESELHTLCFDLSVDYDALPVGSKWDKARELVAYMQRAERLSDLIDAARQERPAAPWHTIDVRTEPPGDKSDLQGVVAHPDPQGTQLLFALDANVEARPVLDLLAKALALDPAQRLPSIEALVAGLPKPKCVLGEVADHVFDQARAVQRERTNYTQLLSDATDWAVNPAAAAPGFAPHGSVSVGTGSLAPAASGLPSVRDSNFTVRLEQPAMEPADDDFSLVSLADGTGFPLTGDNVKIGRLSENDLVLTDSSVSRFHAELVYHSPGRWYLTDLGSVSGTSVNHRRLAAPLPLEHGDLITIGRLQFRFEATPRTPPLEAAPAAVIAGHYDVLSNLGRGGMGRVLKAYDRTMQRVVAIKKLDPPTSVDAAEATQLVSRFQHEIRLLQRLDHPGIVKIYDFLAEGQAYYYIMEYVEGQTLQYLLEQATDGKLPEAQVLEIAQQLCVALDYLHTRQPPIIFRDVKPGNIMIMPDRGIKLLDFGIARYHVAGKSGDTELLGTPGYAAPEQYGGSQTDTRADIYALGATLYHAFTGFDPGRSPFNLQPAITLNPAISPEVSNALERATRPDRNQRFSSVMEFWQALAPASNKAAFPPRLSGPET